MAACADPRDEPLAEGARMFQIAILGAGRIGRIHAHNAAIHPLLGVKYIADPAQDAAGTLAGEIGAVAADVDQVLGDPEIAGVIIASPTDQHIDQTLKAAAAGKAILCEKPVDLDLPRARAAASELAVLGARVLIGFNRRCDPDFAALKARLADGTLGPLESLHITSHDPAPPPIAYVRGSGGLFKDMAIHDFDMARWLLGEQPAELFAAATCLIDPAIGKAGDVDTAKTILRCASGRLVVISNSRRSGYGYDQRIEAFCAGGLVKADNRLESNVSTWRAAGMASDMLQNFFLDRYAEAYRRELAHFVDILAGQAVPLVTFEDGVAALALAEAAAASVRAGQPVRLE